MLSGIRIFSSDANWVHILSDLNATVTDDVRGADVNMDELKIDLPVSPIELKSAILSALDNTDTLRQIFGRDVTLSRLPAQIIVCLYRTGGMSASELKAALGYAPDATTHTVDTAICGLRRAFGHGFIINDNGIYRLGKL